jgi:hypothetical protein
MMRNLLIIIIFLLLSGQTAAAPRDNGHIIRSVHFDVIYQENSAYPALRLLEYAEGAFSAAVKIFNIRPDKTITVVLSDKIEPQTGEDIDFNNRIARIGFDGSYPSLFRSVSKDVFEFFMKNNAAAHGTDAAVSEQRFAEALAGYFPGADRSTPAGTAAVTASPDGKKNASVRNNALQVIDADGKRRIAYSPFLAKIDPGTLHWSRDSRIIYFIVIDASLPSVIAVSPDGKITYRTRLPFYRIEDISMSANMKLIAFSAVNGGSKNIYLYDVEKNFLRKVTADYFDNGFPDISDDMSYIYFTSNRNKRGDKLGTVYARYKYSLKNKTTEAESPVNEAENKPPLHPLIEISPEQFIYPQKDYLPVPRENHFRGIIDYTDRSDFIFGFMYYKKDVYDINRISIAAGARSADGNAIPVGSVSYCHTDFARFSFSAGMTADEILFTGEKLSGEKSRFSSRYCAAGVFVPLYSSLSFGGNISYYKAHDFTGHDDSHGMFSNLIVKYDSVKKIDFLRSEGVSAKIAGGYFAGASAKNGMFDFRSSYLFFKNIFSGSVHFKGDASGGHSCFASKPYLPSHFNDRSYYRYAFNAGGEFFVTGDFSPSWFYRRYGRALSVAAGGTCDLFYLPGNNISNKKGYYAAPVLALFAGESVICKAEYYFMKSSASDRGVRVNVSVRF